LLQQQQQIRRPVVPQPGISVGYPPYTRSSNSSNSGSANSDQSDTESQGMYSNVNSQQRRGNNGASLGGSIGGRSTGDFTDSPADLAPWQPLLHARHHQAPPPPANGGGRNMPLPPPPTGGNSRHVQFAAANMLHHSEETTANAPLGAGAARSPLTSGGSPEVFTFAEVDVAAQKFSQLGTGGRSFQYPAAGEALNGANAAQRSGEEAAGGRHVHFQEEVRSAGVMRGEPPRAAYPLFGSNYSTIV
jgi:hypothetical protein